MILIIILLTIQTVLISGLLYLNWKRTPVETQQEIKRQIQPPKTEVKEWMPPESEEDIAFKETLNKIYCLF